ncbi:MAG: caspase family protein [Caulobacteraceae bacterium]|nr:caspase family protein [Caulobacteraceae bacterium]
MRNVLFSTALSLSLAVSPLMTTGALAQQLRPGGQVQGELARGDDQLDSGEFVDVYEIQGRAGETLRATMRSTEFDTYLMIRGPSGFAEDNDDGGDDGTNSTLEVRLPATGTYRLSATSYEPGESGRYALSLGGAGGGGAARPQGNTGGGALSANGVAMGTLAQGDRQLNSGEFSDVWTLPVRRGQTYTINLSSADFDTYLMVRGPGGLSEDNDDNAGQRGTTDSAITFTAQADGQVNVSATSFASGETGRYQIRVSQVGGASPAGPARPGGAAVDGVIAVGQTVNGSLGQGDRRLDSGEYINVWTLRGRRGQTVDLRLTSSAFDPYVAIQGPGGFSDFNDDDPDGDGSFNSRLVVTLPADGDYRITATSYQAGEEGAYRLAALPADGRTAPSRPSQQSYVEDDTGQRAATGGSIQLGQTVGGSLQAGDDQLSSGEYSDSFTFVGRRGQRIAAELTSSAFDAYLILRTPGGEQIDNDDGEDGTNSRIDTVLAEDGEYEVQVTSYAPGETGSYRFSVAPSMGTPRQAAVQGGARVHAIMVGVSDYGGVANNLSYTDEDAEKLAETLERGGVLAPGSVVLTNAEATVAGVRRAFAQVARDAGPDDMFLFFFSGHGSQEEGGPSAREPDGRTETIVLRDGEITDAEMAELFAGLNTRLSLLVLDSCFSGGFARNVVDRPGVMGLFSSEEDLTSSVADKFEAGGYLSHFLRAGLAGEGDVDGDGAVTAGELATYLRRQFVAEVSGVEAETIEGQRNYQNLVIDRGGVQVDDIVLRLASNGSAQGGL